MVLGRLFADMYWLWVEMPCSQDTQSFADMHKTALEPPGDLPFEEKGGKSQTIPRTQNAAEKTKKKGLFTRKKKKVCHLYLLLFTAACLWSVRKDWRGYLQGTTEGFEPLCSTSVMQ